MKSEKINDFINRQKFLREDFYPGISDKQMIDNLTEKINGVARDFLDVMNYEKSTDKDYINKIEIGLSKFYKIEMQLDTEDKEKICDYFQELMDIVELKSSDGLLNNFIYGFDPNMLK